MDIWQGLIIITAVHLLAAASPGPDFVLVSQQSLVHGKKAGILCSIGIALGLSVHIVYSAFGLAAIIASSITALWAIKLLGGGYLIYLGIKGLRARASATEGAPHEKSAERSAWKTVGLGFLCNALNPKAPLYFVALFTVVLSAATPALHIAIYGAWMMLIQLAWFSLVTFILSNPKVTRKFQRLGHRIDQLTGLAMLILGIKVLATKAN